MDSDLECAVVVLVNLSVVKKKAQKKRESRTVWEKPYLV